MILVQVFTPKGKMSAWKPIKGALPPKTSDDYTMILVQVFTPKGELKLPLNWEKINKDMELSISSHVNMMESQLEKRILIATLLWCRAFLKKINWTDQLQTFAG